MIQTIKLSQLVPSKRNVRRRSDAAADAQLHADVEAHGLLQNLIVTANKKPRGTFGVEAGGRRHAALKTLADEGKIAPDFDVPCLVLDDLGSAVSEASLAENFQKLALNPADECLAFQHFIKLGSDVDGLARRFGVTVRFVEGRLRLASLAPVVFQALADSDITLDIAKAYLQWHFRVNGADRPPPEPILRDIRTIGNRDALIEWDERVLERDATGAPVTCWDGGTMKPHPVTGKPVPDETARVEVYRYVNPRAAKWPKADFIVGNPPFIGNKRMRERLGGGYVDALFRT